MNDLKEITVAELAEDAFLKGEAVKALSAMNTPTDFEERKSAAIQYAEAQAAANRANLALDAAVKAGLS